MTKGPEDGFSELKMKDKMLDPDQAMSRELADQIASRIARDVKSENNDDLAEITKSINERDDKAATAQIDQALHDKGFPEISISTDDKLNGQRTEIREVEKAPNGVKVEKWWDQAGQHGIESNGHSENTVSLPPSGEKNVGGGIHGHVGGKVGG